jgi:DNA-binding winged helix-turn-helix (wHTH) protein/Tol biopolymer transport system component
MKATSKRSSGVRFGQFELNLPEEKLLKRGLPVRLENQPFQILAALLEHPGEVVSREDLCASLWPDGTYVDFDEGLNTAIKKLRYALGDSSENPVFIETIPRRGYRFIAPVQDDGIRPLEPSSAGNGHRSLEARPELLVATQPVSKTTWTARRLIALGIIVVGACWLLYRMAFPAALRVTQITRFTNSGRLEPWGRITSDGSRLFFLEREGDHWNTRQISVAGGESMPFGSSPQNTKIFDISADKSEMLFAPFTLRGNNLPLWLMPLVGGAPRRVGDLLVSSANFSPDGTKIAFTNEHGAFLANRDGSGVRQLAALPECWGIAWSPDGTILRFFSEPGRHLWQVTSTGRDLHPFLPSWTAWDGRWTPDGSYYIFTATKDGQNALWALRESPSFPWLRQTPTQITFPPLNFDDPLPSRDGHSIYAAAGLSQQIDVVRFDPGSHQFKPIFPGFNVTEVEFSPDHQWILYSNWTQLWRSRPDGSDRLQLAGPPSVPHNYFAHWSPDSKRILFEDLEDDKGTIYLVAAEGGPAQQPVPPGPSRRWPNWSTDGQTIGFTVEEEAGKTSPPEPGIYLFDLAQGHSTLIAGSGGLIGGRWSPDGRFLAANSEDGSVIKLLDLRMHRWSEVARGTLISFPVWSADSVLYFQDILAPGEPVYRFQPGDTGPQRAYSFEDILQSGAQRCAFQGFTPDGSLLVQVNRGGGDIYALTVGIP